MKLIWQCFAATDSSGKLRLYLLCLIAVQRGQSNGVIGKWCRASSKAGLHVNRFIAFYVGAVSIYPTPTFVRMSLGLPGSASSFSLKCRI